MAVNLIKRNIEKIYNNVNQENQKLIPLKELENGLLKIMGRHLNSPKEEKCNFITKNTKRIIIK